MKETINGAEALLLAQAQELIKSYKKGVSARYNSDGKIIPSDESMEEIAQEYTIEEMPDK